MDALREWMESDLDVIMVGTWRLCGNGWSLIWTLSWLAHGGSAKGKILQITRKNAVKTALPAQNALKQSKTSSFGPQKSKIATQAKSAKKQERNTKAENKCSKTRGKRTLQTKTSQQQQRKEAQKGVRAACQPPGNNNSNKL